MEYLNRIEIAGVLGSIRIQEFKDQKIASFSVLTEFCYETENMAKVCESTWHTVVAFDSVVGNVASLQKGDKVMVIGRVRNTRYTAADGGERIFSDIYATTLEKVD